tara:strand:- start:1393 stop:5682 length:4290 start_codon:yes stop_codon:yes gene_type:complete
LRNFLIFAAAFSLAAAPAHAGPAVAAVASFLTPFLGAATAGFAAQFVVGTGLQIIGGLLAKSRMDKPKVDVQTDLQVGDDLPLSFSVGEYATAGKRKYVKSWGKNNRYITQIIEFSGLPQGFGDIWVDDERATWRDGRVGAIPAASGPGGVGPMGDRATGDIPSGFLLVGDTLDNYRENGDGDDPRIWVNSYDGMQADADPFMVWVAENDPDYPWGDAHIGIGKSYAIITTQYDSETLTQVPQFLIEPEALPLYDIRKDSTNGGSGAHRWGQSSTYEPTSNPAVIAYNIIRGIYFGSEWVFGGKNLAAWRLPQSEWIAAANTCDDPVTLAAGGSEPRYRCGMEITCDMQAADVLEEIGKAANMRFAEVGGRIKPMVDLPATVAFAITDDDIIITEGQSFKPFYPLSETYNAISATYPERAEKWTNRDAVEYIDAEATAEDGGRYLPTSMSYGAVPFRKQIRRLQRSQLRDFRRMRRHQFSLPPEVFGLEPGIDVVSWTSQRNGYVNKKFLVESVQRAPGMNVAVSLREVDPSDYDGSRDFEAPTPVIVPKNPVVVIQPIRGLAFVGVIIEDEDGNARRPAIRVTCDGDEVGVTEIQIQGRVLGKDTSIDTKRDFGGDHTWLLRDVLPATVYQCRARLLTNGRARPVWSLWYDVTTPDVRASWADFEQDLRDEIEGALQDAADAAVAAEQANQNYIELRGDLDSASSSLSADIAAAESLANDNLNIAKDYTDTGLLNESAQRLSGDQALAAQIKTLTAVLNSENYLENPRYSDGLTGWSGNTAQASVVAQDDLSADPIVANAPTAFFASIPGRSDATTVLYQDFPIEWEGSDVFQWRLQTASSETGRSTTAEVRWFDNAGSQIGGAVTTDVTPPAADEWKIFSGQHTPPAGAVAVRFTQRVAQAAATAPVFFADTSFTKVDPSVIARITDLEVVVANNQSAFTLHESEATSRFDDNEAAITSEAATRANAVSSLSSQINTVSATANSKNRTFRQSSAPSSPQTGDVWYDLSDSRRPKRWSGSAWVDVDDTRIASISATVTTQATAIADLEGNATAGYLIRVQSGGAVSLIDLIAADGSGRQPTSIIKLSADNIIADGTLSTKKLIVADFQNYFDGWWSKDSSPFVPTGWNGDWSGVTYAENGTIKVDPSGPLAEKYRLRPVQVKPGDQFYLSIWVARSGNWNGTNTNSKLRIGDQDNAFLASINYDSSIPHFTNGFEQRVLNFTVPAGTNTLNITLNGDGTDGAVFIGAMEMRRKNAGSVLIYNGGVTADLINSETQQAINARFVSLAAANIRVANAEIGTLMLDGESVTVPASQNLSNTVSGNNGWQNVSSINFTLPFAGNVTIMWFGSPSYYNNETNAALGLRIRINGNIVSERLTDSGNSGFANQWMSFGIAEYLPAGTHSIRADWFGQNGNVRLQNRTLMVTGTMR